MLVLTRGGARDRLMSRNLLFYVVLLLVCGAGIYAIVDLGSRLETAPARQPVAVQPVDGQTVDGQAGANGFVRVLAENVRHPLSLLLLQVLIIVAAGKALGSLFGRIRQPPVIGE